MMEGLCFFCYVFIILHVFRYIATRERFPFTYRLQRVLELGVIPLVEFWIDVVFVIDSLHVADDTQENLLFNVLQRYPAT